MSNGLIFSLRRISSGVRIDKIIGDSSRANRRDLDAESPSFIGQGFGQRHHAVLRGAIDACAGPRLHPGNTAAE
jgi:hypothetical protein